MKGADNTGAIAEQLAELLEAKKNYDINYIDLLKRKVDGTDKDLIDTLADKLFDPRPALCSFIFVEVPGQKISENQISLYMDYSNASSGQALLNVRLGNGVVKSKSIDLNEADSKIKQILLEENLKESKYILRYAIENRLLDYLELNALDGSKKTDTVGTASKATTPALAQKEISDMNEVELRKHWDSCQPKEQDLNSVQVNNRPGTRLFTIDVANSLNEALGELKKAFEGYKNALNSTEGRDGALASAKENIAKAGSIAGVLSVEKLNEVVNPLVPTSLSSAFNFAKSKNPKAFDMTSSENFISCFETACAQTSGEIHNDLKLAKKVLKALESAKKVSEIFEVANPDTLQKVAEGLKPKATAPQSRPATSSDVSGLKRAAVPEGVMPPRAPLAGLLAGGSSNLKKVIPASAAIEGSSGKSAAFPPTPPSVSSKMPSGGASFLDQLKAKGAAREAAQEVPPAPENIAKKLLEQLENKHPSSHVDAVGVEKKEAAKKPRNRG